MIDLREVTVNGRAELVVQDAASYQALLDKLEEAQTMAAVREGMEEIKRGEGIPFAEAKKRPLKSMAFRVEISPRAYRDLDSIATVIGGNGFLPCSTPLIRSVRWQSVAL